MKADTISGGEAINRARNLKLVQGSWFTLLRCRVRPALREDTFKMDGDMYFTFEDLETGEPKMCFKRLIPLRLLAL